MQENEKDIEWQTQKMCSDYGKYQLVVEKQKNSWECEQKRESWKWSIDYHGTVVASGSVNSMEEAKNFAVKNIPSNAEDK